ncbi:MAG: restriction endonuclease [Clostridia bacterium]|nr:restriction endonuclease [Clostridia bacterium]
MDILLYLIYIPFIGLLCLGVFLPLLGGVLNFLLSIFNGIWDSLLTATNYLWGSRCEHNIRNGKKYERNGKLKCPACQKALEEQYNLAAERHLQDNELKAKAEQIQQKFSDMLSEAVNFRNHILYQDEKEIRQLSPLEFEKFIATLYTRLGYRVTLTPFANDGGKDAFATKNGIKYLIECKHYQQTATIGRPMLQKLYAAMTEEHIDNGIFIATCEYSKPAIEYGKKVNIQTLKMRDIVDMLHSVYDPAIDEKQTYTICCKTCGEEVTFKLFDDIESTMCSNGHEVKNVFWDTKQHEPICPIRGSKYKRSHDRRGDSYVCSNYPTCLQRISCYEYETRVGIQKRKNYHHIQI